MEPGSLLRALPKVDVLASAPELTGYPPAVRISAARAAIQRLRDQAVRGEVPTFEEAVSLAVQEAARSGAGLVKVINMSGVVCHTGLGRAPLAEAALAAIQESAGGYAALEFDFDTGKRGDRQSHARDLLCSLTGAEDALVVNNAAAGVYLTLTALALGREVILSRGQMVEIGGSFRLPEIVAQSGCRLVEVGCTNRTRLSDYSQAITPDTAVILRCHPSNFALVGFTEVVPLEALGSLSRDRGSVLVDDQGSGLIVDATAFGMTVQPTVQDSLRKGADIVVASCDKLLGGPQAGMILGRSDLIAQIRKHPLARAMRVDKLTIAALTATLKLYLDDRVREIPIWRYLSKDLSVVEQTARRMAEAWPGGSVIEPGVTEAGSGAAPGTGIPTWRVGLVAEKPDELLSWLRKRSTPIVGRIEKHRVWLDPRTLEPEDEAIVLRSLAEWRV